MVVKQRDKAEWLKVKLTSGRLKRYKGCWFNYEKVDPGEDDEKVGSVDLRRKGRWYTFSTSEDEERMRSLIEGTKEEDVELNENETLPLEDEELSWDGYTGPVSNQTKNTEGESIDDLINQIQNLGNQESGDEIDEDHDNDLNPRLITSAYNDYHNLQYNKTCTDLFLNEKFEYRITRYEKYLREDFHILIRALEDAKSLYFQVKKLFVELHQTCSSRKLRQILQSLKLSQGCLEKIKNGLIDNEKRLQDNEAGLPDKIKEEILESFTMDGVNLYKIIEVYSNICTKMALNSSSNLTCNDDKGILIMTKKPTVHEDGAMAKALEKEVLHTSDATMDPTASLFLEMDRAMHRLREVSRKDSGQLSHRISKTPRQQFTNTNSDPTNSSNIVFQDIVTPRVMSTSADASLARDPLNHSSHPGMSTVGAEHAHFTSGDSSNQDESSSSSDDEQIRRYQTHKRPDIPTPPSRVDSRVLSKLEQALTEMKDRTHKVRSDFIKSIAEIEEMDENDLLNVSKYESSSWAAAIEKLDNSRYTISGCLNSIQSHLSVRKISKIKSAMKVAKSSARQASETLKDIKEEVKRRNVSSIPVSSEISKCAVIGKFSGTSLPHIYTWVKDIELAIKQLKIPLTLQGNFIKKYLIGEAENRVDLEIPRSKTNPTKEKVFNVLRKYYGRTFIIMKQLGDKHAQIKPIPSQQNSRSSSGRLMSTISKVCVEHLKVITAAEELAAEVKDEQSTILDEHYLLALKAILPQEVLLYVPASGSLDKKTRFETIKASITQLEQTSSMCAIEQSLDDQAKDTSTPKVLMASTGSKVCYNCNEPGHRKDNCPQDKSILCYSCGKAGHVAAACANSSSSCFRCGGKHPESQCPNKTSDQASASRFPRGTTTAITTCRICKVTANSEGREVQPSLHGVSSTGWVDSDTCPVIINLDVASKADHLDKIRVCRACLKRSSYTNLHPGSSCDLLRSKGLNHLRCTVDSCNFRVTTCRDHLTQNKEKLENMKAYYATKDQAICFLSSCDDWRQKVVTIRKELRDNLTHMKESVETMKHPSLLLSASHPNLPFLCRNPSELPSLTNKKVINETEGTPAFLVFRLQGEDGQALPIMFDSGASFSLFRTDVMGRSLIAAEVEDDTSGIIVGIGGTKQVRSWKCLLPLAEGNSYQVVSAQSLESILTVNAVDLMPSLSYMKRIHAPSLDTLEVQTLKDADIAGLIGVKSSILQPKLITMSTLGVGLYKICLKAAFGESQYALGGNIPSLVEIQRELGSDFISSSYVEVEQRMNGFYDMRGSLLVTREELDFQAIAQKESLKNIEQANLENDALPEPPLTSGKLETEATPEDQAYDNTYSISAVKNHICDPKCIKGHKFDEAHMRSTLKSKTMLTATTLNNTQVDAAEGIPKFILRGLMGIMASIEDNYRCTSCLGCKACKNSMKVEASSLKIEKEMSKLRECVRIDEEKKVIICKLPLEEGFEDFLAPNFEAAKRRLRNELLKLKKLPPKEQEEVKNSFIKLRKLRYVRTMSELTGEERQLMAASKVNYFIPVSIAYKESSVSTPARITMDASSKTLSSHSLNSLLPTGSNSFNIAKLVQAWRLKGVGFFTDLSKFYNSFQLSKEYWPLQQMVWNENLDPDEIPTSYYIVTLIYGVSCVASLTEIGLEMLEKLYPEELKPLLAFRYIDDLARSFDTLPEAQRVAAIGLEKLKEFGLKSKGSVFTGVKAPEEMVSSNGTVQVVGHAWESVQDTFQLRVPQIILGKKSKSKGKTTFLKVFKGDSLEALNEFLPENLTFRNLLSLTAAVWDISGQMSPLTGMLWNCIRRACLRGRGYDRIISKDLRKEFVEGLWEVQLLKQYRYPRSQITPSTTAINGILFCFSDASLNFEQSICYASFQGRDGTWTCQFMQAKNALVHVNRSIPNCELNAASTTAKIASAVIKNNPESFTRSILCVDSTTVLFWAEDITSKLDVFRRSRTQIIRQTFNNLYFIRSANNPADTGTRVRVRATDISPYSRFYNGPEYVSLGEDECIRLGILTPSKEVTSKGIIQPRMPLVPQDAQESHMSTGSNEDNFIGVVTRSQAKVQTGTPAEHSQPEDPAVSPMKGREQDQAELAQPETDLTRDSNEEAHEKQPVTLGSSQTDYESDGSRLRREVLRMAVAQDYLICPLQYGLPMSVKSTALVLKFILNLTNRLITKGLISQAFHVKLKALWERMSSMGLRSTMPAIFVAHSPSQRKGKKLDLYTSYKECTLKIKQTVLTYPGVTKARKGIEHAMKLFNEDVSNWCRPITKEDCERLEEVARGIKVAMKLALALDHYSRREKMRERAVETLAFLTKIIQKCVERSKNFKTYHEMAEVLAQVETIDFKGIAKDLQNRSCTGGSTIGFVSIMKDVNEARFYSNIATHMMVKVAQQQILNQWSSNKQATHGTWINGVLISRHRWRDASLAMEDLGVKGMNTEFLSGFQVNTNAPVLPRSSALYLSLACHIHERVAGMKALNSAKSFTHRSARLDYLISLHFAYSPGGNMVFQRIKDLCVSCHMKNKAQTKVKFGPLSDKLLSFASPFSVVAVDLVGPFMVRQMPHSRSSRSQSGTTKAYIVVFTCRITHLTWGEVCESRKTPDVCSAFTRFAAIWGVPRHVTTDEEGALQKILREGTFLCSTEDKLFRQLGIKVETVPVSHHQRNPAEPRCKSIQRLIKGVDLDKQRVTIFGLQDITYLAATLTNATPLGTVLRNGSGAGLKVLTPLSFITRGVDRERKVLRAPIFFPTSLSEYFKHMDEHYKQMLFLYHTIIIPSLLQPERFIMEDKESQRLAVGDIVYFNKRPQQKAEVWSLGRVHKVVESRDGEVRVIQIIYYGSSTSDELQESEDAQDLTLEDSVPTSGLDNSLREHTTTRDAREVVKLPVVSDDLQGHFENLAQTFSAEHVSNNELTKDLQGSTSKRLPCLVCAGLDNDQLITSAYLLEAGVLYKDSVINRL